MPVWSIFICPRLQNDTINKEALETEKALYFTVAFVCLVTLFI